MQQFVIIIIFWWSTACRVLAPQLGIEPVPPKVEAWSLKHWIAREVSAIIFTVFIFMKFLAFSMFPTLDCKPLEGRIMYCVYQGSHSISTV